MQIQGLGVGFVCRQSVCVAGDRPWVPSPALEKKLILKLNFQAAKVVELIDSQTAWMSVLHWVTEQPCRAG